MRFLAQKELNGNGKGALRPQATYYTVTDSVSGIVESAQRESTEQVS